MVGVLEVVQVAEQIVIDVVNFYIFSGKLDRSDEFQFSLLIEVSDEVVAGSQL